MFAHFGATLRSANNRQVVAGKICLQTRQFLSKQEDVWSTRDKRRVAKLSLVRETEFETSKAKSVLIHQTFFVDKILGTFSVLQHVQTSRQSNRCKEEFSFYRFTTKSGVLKRNHLTLKIFTFPSLVAYLFPFLFYQKRIQWENLFATKNYFSRLEVNMNLREAKPEMQCFKQIPASTEKGFSRHGLCELHSGWVSLCQTGKTESKNSQTQGFHNFIPFSGQNW